MASGSSSESDKEMARFSDGMLAELNDEFRNHVTRCEDRFSKGDEQFGKLVQAQTSNTEAITSITEAITSITRDIASITKDVSKLVEETREIVQLHKDFKGVARIGGGLQSFGLWLMKWPLIGAGVYACGTWILNNFSS